MKIPITKPFFGSEELEAIQKPLQSGWVVQGPFVEEFEQKFGQFVGSPFSVATSSCTTALHLAVAALDLKAGDEVIVPAFTWVSTANVVEYMGAKPVFCDIDLQTFNLDVDKVKDCITSKTVGILPVHLFGLCADMPAIMDLAKKHKLWVVEDAACAFGSWIGEQHAGTWGEAGCFSFHPRKSITTGEGGILITQEAKMNEKAHVLKEHGASKTDLHRHENQKGFLLPEYEHLGYNYRMTDIQGALGVAQMDRAEWILDKRTELAKIYDQALKGLSSLQSPVVPSGYRHGYQAYVCLFAPQNPTLENVELLHEKRNEIMQKLEEKGIATRQGTHAPVNTGYYAKKYQLKAEDFPNALLAEKLSLALPLYPQMTDDEQKFVIQSLKEIS